PAAFDVGARLGCHVGDPTWDVGRCLAGPPERVAEGLRPWIEAGANQLQVRLRSRDAAELCDQVERFGAEVAPLLTP
ncbi:MAG: LLM class F420-dependent oxidoreductase, partial [Acidimicrobiia bacterium]